MALSFPYKRNFKSVNFLDFQTISKRAEIITCIKRGRENWKSILVLFHVLFLAIKVAVKH